MMALTSSELEQLADMAHSLIGKRVKFDESISRSREIGRHDRHFSTHTHFTFIVEDVITAFSGAQLALLGAEARYGISLDSVVSFEADELGLEVVEHFEQKTERRSRITAVE